VQDGCGIKIESIRQRPEDGCSALIHIKDN